MILVWGLFSVPDLPTSGNQKCSEPQPGIHSQRLWLGGWAFTTFSRVPVPKWKWPLRTDLVFFSFTCRVGWVAAGEAPGAALGWKV